CSSVNWGPDRHATSTSQPFAASVYVVLSDWLHELFSPRRHGGTEKRTANKARSLNERITMRRRHTVASRYSSLVFSVTPCLRGEKTRLKIASTFPNCRCRSKARSICCSESLLRISESLPTASWKLLPFFQAAIACFCTRR